MVFFTCFHCGDSVKKPAVEKHYNFKCKNEIMLTCMDCLKDFDKHSYQGHTTCISEEERYSGKDYVAKESSNSGAKKQQTWVEVVQSILQNPNVYQVTPDLKRCLHRITGYNNVPRKKVKFENFVKNSFRIGNDQAEALWKLLEKALDIFKQECEKEKQKSASQNVETKDNCSEKSDIKSTSPEQKDSKSKRKKQDNNNDESNEISLKDDMLNDEPVKKKKKKEKDQGNNESVLNGQSVEKNENEFTKKKIKENNQGNNESVLKNGQSAEKNKNESAKKKKKHIQENQVLESTENMTNNIKSKINGKVKNNMDVTEESVDIGQFDWKAIIFKIVSKKTDGINIEKLKEKVFNKYKVHFNAEEINYKIEKTFNKKLKKISSLSIEDNIVKIKTK